MESDFLHDAVHDLSLMHLLAIHYECLIRLGFDINGKGTPELVKAARTVTAALEHLKTILQEQAATEYPNKDFESFTLKDYEGCWPPKISGKN